MSRKITATIAARRFCGLLGTVKFRGAKYTILRGGKPIAILAPVESVAQEKTLSELTGLLERIPSLGKESAAFEHDLNRLVTSQPHLPREGPWE